MDLCYFSECINLYGSDAQCDYWALFGQCEDNPDWMNLFCEKTCSKCDDKPPGEFNGLYYEQNYFESNQKYLSTNFMVVIMILWSTTSHL